MRSHLGPARPAPSASRNTRTRAVAAAAVIGAVVLTGCGSSSPTEDSTKREDTAFCTAVDDFVTASKAGDRTEMADALEGAIEDVHGDARRDVRAYVQALRSSPANESPDGDGVEADSTDDAFRRYVADTCGDVKLPTESDATTTTSPPQGSGGGGTTDDTGVDGSGTGTDSGSGSGTSGGM